MTAKEKKEKTKSVLQNAFYIEISRINKKTAIIVSGVIGVPDFSEKEATLINHSGKIFIQGSELSINIFENKVVEVSGKVDNISFE